MPYYMEGIDMVTLNNTSFNQLCKNHAKGFVKNIDWYSILDQLNQNFQAVESGKLFLSFSDDSRAHTNVGTGDMEDT